VRFQVEVGGQRRTIEVARSDRDWAVTIGRQTMRVSVASSGSTWSLLVARDGRAPTSHEVAFGPVEDGGRLVHVDGRAVHVALLDHGARAARGGETVAGTSSRVTVVAPMPGRVVKVLVGPGDVVTPRQGLVVVEAMKMENELRSPGAGTVTEVRVREGATVEARAVLVVIET
jgi:acetyl/propionyl-CoA carboxylase alpha subunit